MPIKAMTMTIRICGNYCIHVDVAFEVDLRWVAAAIGVAAAISGQLANATR
jgi:hypothetical protein